jgi:ubiquinone/menaquinone biosynthesis C-methylase UbiE
MEILNPQAEQMADESMVRNLAAQAQAIWPQEREIISSYGLPENARILDLACGTGEFSARILEAMPRATLLGIDVEREHLKRAGKRCAKFGKRASFETGDAFDLGLPKASFDFAVCRHLFQAVPRPERIAAQMKRVLKRGGRIHLIVEDYSLMLFHPVKINSDMFFQRGPMGLAAATDTDLRIGRKTPAILRELGFKRVRAEYVVLDTLRVKPKIFADIWRAWRDGYSAVIAEKTGQSREQVWNDWNDMISAIENPKGYSVWLVPVVSGVA